MKNFLLIVSAVFVFAACNCGPKLQRTTVVYDAHHFDSSWVQLPCSYASSSDTQHYPLLVFFHGIGESGNDGGLNVMLTLGPPKYMADSIRFAFTNANKIYNFIVFCPQDYDGYRTPENVDAILNYIVAHYRVDVRRIYLTGLSAGARNCLNYVTDKQAYANRIAAIVPMSSIVMDATHTSHFDYVANANVHTRIFIGTSDASNLSNNQSYANAINALSPGLAELTTYAGGHCCWNGPYSTNHDFYNPNIYEWMLQFHK